MLRQEILTFIQNGGTDGFGPLALQLFEHQRQHNAPYAAFCKAIAKAPIRHWTDIPPVPTDAFKFDQHPLITRPLTEHKFCFHTSGTTLSIPGKHYMLDAAHYDASILSAWQFLQLPQLPRHYIGQPLSQRPHSSLAHMFQILGAVPHQKCDTPILLMGTALDFLHHLENQSAHKLPENSWLLETGGYKGTQNTITKPELYAQLETKFGVPSEHIINEYSMTELSSQFYTTGLGNIHQGPPWARVRIIHPVTGQEVAEGKTGCIVIYDLANIDSVLAIQTQDLAIKHPNHTFQLIGRDPAALPKGCSIPADDFHQN